MKRAISLFFVLTFWLTGIAQSPNVSVSLTACYSLDGTGTTEPINNLTPTLNAVTSTVDRFNNPSSALAFNGSTLSYVELPGSPLLKPTNAFSFSCWIKTSIIADQYILMTRNPTASNFESYCLHLANVGGQLRIRAKKGDGSGGTVLITGTSNLSLNTWYHFVLTIDNANMNLYTNGSLIGSATITFPFSYMANKNVILGGSNETSFNLPFTGAMDNLRFYNRVLIPAEVTELYTWDPVCLIPPTSTLTACYALDGNLNEPINNLSGILSSVTPTVDRFNNANSAYHFTGANTSYIQLPNSPLLKPTTALSCNMWLRFDDMASKHYVLYTSNGCGSFFEGYAVTVESVGPNYKFSLTKSNSTCSGGGQAVLYGNANISALTWYNLGLYIGTDSLKIYVNGAVDAVSATSSSPLAYSNANVYFGSTLASWNYPMRATLDNVKFYHGKLSNQEVSLLYSNDPPCVNQPATAINFDGIDDFVSPNVLLNAPANNFTYEMWARPTATHEIDIETNGGLNIDGINNQRYLLWPTHRGVDGGIGISVGTNGVSVYEHGNNFIESLLTWTGTLTTWSHLAIVFNNKQPSLYVNGTLVKTGLTSTKVNVWPSLGGGGAFPGQIGGIGGGFYGYYSGDVDEFRLWNSARTQAQIAGNRFVEFNCPQAGLLAYYKFNHGIASANNALVTTATDYSGNNYTATLTALTLNGNISNWISPGAPLTSTLSTLSLSASATSTLLCPGQSATLTATGATSYTWLPGNSTGSILVVNPGTSTNYTVTGSNGICTGNFLLPVTVQSLSLSVTATPTAVCPGGSATLTAGNASSYAWQPGNFSGAVVIVSPPVTTAYTVTGNNGACFSTATITVPVLPNATVGVLAQQTLVCPGYVIGINGMGAQTYTWQPGNLVGASIIPTVNATTLFTVTGTSSLGCTDTETVLISVSNCSIPPLGCNTTFYSQGTATNGDRIIITDISSPNTSTVSSVILPYGALGLAIGPAFSFPAPNPTFWTARGGVLWYHNGTTFINSGQFTSAWNFAGSKNYLYGMETSGTIFRYNGTNTVSLGFIIPPIKDIAADDQDNFYLLSYTHLSIFNSAAVPTCSAIPHSGLSGSNGNYAGGLAIIGHSVIASNGVFGNLNIGTMTGATLNFTPAVYNGGTYDFASCPFVTAFSSTITASNPSVSCSTPTVILSVTTQPSIISPALSYTWTGPGIVSPQNLPNVAVNAAGVYTCSLRSCNGGTSVATVTVGNSIVNPILTASASPANICAGNSTTLSAATANTYTWQPGNLPGNAVTVSPSATTIYSVSGTNGFGCMSTATVLVTVGSLTLNISPATATLCTGQSLTLTASGSNAYTWTPGGTTNSLLVVSPATSTGYTVSSIQGGCIGTATAFITVNTLPNISASSSPTSICVGSTATLTANGGASYTWQPSGSQTQTISVNPLGSNIYTVIGKSAQGCSATAIVSLSVNPSPTLTVTSNPAIVCMGNSSTLTANGAVNYTWQPGNQTNSLISVSPVSNTTYTVKGVSAAGCSTTALITVSVVLTPTIILTANASTICIGQSTGLSASGATSYTWQPGNSTGPAFNVAPISSTTYTVNGSISGCGSASATILITVNPKPIISASPTVLCSGNSVSLNASAPGSSITWQPGNLVGNSVSDIPASTTLYTATANYSSGSCSTTQTLSVIVNPTPTLNIISSTNTLCIGASALLTASGAPSYTWLPGLSTNTSISVSPPVSTTYTLAGTSPAGCLNYTTFLLQVAPTPTVFVTPIGITGSWTICEGGGLLIDVQGANNYTFTPASSVNTTTAFPNAYVANPSVTTIYTLSGEAGGCEDSFSFTVTVNPAPVITISNNNTNLCTGQSVALTATGGSDYAWEPGTLSGPSILVSPTVSTSYTVTVLGNSGCTGTAVANIAVSETPTLIISTPSLNVCAGSSATLGASGATTYTWLPDNQTGSNVVIFPASNIVYTVIGANDICLSSAQFSITVIDCNVPHIFGLTNAADNPVPYNSSFYKINFTVIAKNISSDELSNVILNSDLKSTFPYPCSYTVITAPRIKPLNSKLSSNALFDGASQMSLTSPLTSSMLPGVQDTLVYGVLVEPKGFYGPLKNSVVGFATLPNSIVVSDSSNNGFAWDPDKDGDPTNNNEVTIIDLKEIQLFIPEGFSPNDDGKNDLFVIKGQNERRAKFTVFNRWGNKVFENEGTQISWDGKANIGGLSPGSDKLPAATYFYVLEFLGADKQSVSGFIILQY